MKKIAFLPIALLTATVLWLMNACTTIEKGKKGDIKFWLTEQPQDNKVDGKTYYLVKKYKYSKRRIPIGLSSKATSPVYKYGFADADKKILLKAKFDAVELVRVWGYSPDEEVITQVALLTEIAGIPGKKELYNLEGKKFDYKKYFGKYNKVIMMNQNGLDYRLFNPSLGLKTKPEYGMKWVNPDSILIEKREHNKESKKLEIWKETKHIDDLELETF
ncbi:hypothetical protein [Paenimyroides aestuarii]|uniref:Lipoprotein n=1 Tax=Paenimyroides aestuarii TaxID=2968490 RepID=A0ABY5NV92_9FLAO|nr:hypothetical protein [Paenimyroides aestuarii]UUV22378.1 hypothetical protein NPX36_04885 [Paenimyroides aestuarii]